MRTETLSWDDAVTFYGESLPVDGGYVTRLHSDTTCTSRVVAEQDLTFKRTTNVPAGMLCPSCTAGAVTTALSTAMVEMRNLLFRIERGSELRDPRTVALTARRQITELESVHPDFEAARVEALTQAEEIIDRLPLY